jgi:hypothetical protein
MNTSKTSFIAGYPELVMAVIFLPLKRAVCWKLGETLIAAG